jgi:hypothetical protein
MEQTKRLKKVPKMAFLNELNNTLGRGLELKRFLAFSMKYVPGRI